MWTLKCMSTIFLQLVWFHIHKGRHTLLASHDSVITKNGRISVRSHANSTFYLTIHDIQKEDRGYYMCQVNTTPMRSQTGYLEVNGNIKLLFARGLLSPSNSFPQFHQVSSRKKPAQIWTLEKTQQWAFIAALMEDQSQKYLGVGKMANQ